MCKLMQDRCIRKCSGRIQRLCKTYIIYIYIHIYIYKILSLYMYIKHLYIHARVYTTYIYTYIRKTYVVFGVTKTYNFAVINNLRNINNIKSTIHWYSYETVYLIGINIFPIGYSLFPIGGPGPGAGPASYADRKVVRSASVSSFDHNILVLIFNLFFVFAILGCLMSRCHIYIQMYNYI